MRALVWLPVQRLILNVRLRITQQVFQRNGKRSIIWVTLSIGSLSALSLMLYPQLLIGISLPQGDYTLTSTYSSATVLAIFSAYLLAILFLNHSISAARTACTQKQHIRHPTSRGLRVKEVIIRASILGGGYMLLGQLTIAPVIIYYLFVAASEEGLKYLSSISIWHTWHMTRSDLILFALLTALGFAFLENIVYMIHHTELIQGISKQLSSGAGITISRGLVGFLVHMLFTGSIAALSVYALETSQKILWLSIALLVGILLHMSYNILLHYNYGFAIILYLIAGYILLTWLFWKSDGVYIEG